MKLICRSSWTQASAVKITRPGLRAMEMGAAAIAANTAIATAGDIPAMAGRSSERCGGKPHGTLPVWAVSVRQLPASSPLTGFLRD